MVRDTLTGSRIRERRLIAGLKQADLARQVGISASYLNLIEHNRRSIGGKLLMDIAQVLGVEPSMLTEGAEAALISTLREAAADAGAIAAEVDRVDEFAGRFPGWAEVLAACHRRIAALERTVEALSDRLSHDPHLAASLHEVLSTAASIRSTASILAETGELEPEWRERFHRNLNEDSLRLAESSKALVAYLDDGAAATERRGVPLDEVEAFFATRGYHLPELESGAADPSAIVQGGAELSSQAARRLCLAALRVYRRDARLLPLDRFRAAIAAHGVDPVALARQLSVDVPTVFRRLAAMPDGVLPFEIGLVICDASGSFLFRKPIAGFAMPRHGGACPLWPLFAVFSRPFVPIRRRVSQLARESADFDCFAVSWPRVLPDFDTDPALLSAMLLAPAGAAPGTAAAVHPVGSSCRVCPRDGCPARREPSILGEEF